MLCSYAHLDTEKLRAVQDMEKKIGRTLLAMSCARVDPAELPAADLKALRELEDRLCLQLVAVR